MRTWLALAVLSGVPVLEGQTSQSQQAPHATHRRFELGDFRLESGSVLPAAHILYVTYGRLNSRKDNAVLVTSFHGGNHHGYDFLIGPGLALDTAKYFVVVTEMFASGGSSSPSNTAAPFDGPRFPAIAIRDNVAAVYQLLTKGLALRHVGAVLGFSMGAQQALQWGVSHRDFMNKVLAWCGTAKTYPHTWVFLETGILAWNADAAFENGDYRSRPAQGSAAVAAHWAAWVFSSEWWRRELYKPTWTSPEALIQAWAQDSLAQDPNNEISQSRTWQRHNVAETQGFNGDLKRALGSIRAEVLLMPCSTDMYFTARDIEEEGRLIPRAKVVSIPSIWGHAAGAGPNPEDAKLLNREIGNFLK